MPSIATPITKDALMRPLRIMPDDRLAVDLHDDDEINEFALRVSSAQENGWPSRAATTDFAERFPQRKQNKSSFDRHIVVPATDISVQLINNLWPSSQVRFSPDARTVFTYLYATVEHQRLTMHRVARYREFLPRKGSVLSYAVPTPLIVEPFEVGDGCRPMLHQSVALANLLHSDGYGLFMEQGTGKTLPIIAYVDSLCEGINIKHNRMFRGLIVAPKNVRANWEHEFARFSTQPGKVTVLRRGEFKRMKAFFEAMVPGDADQKPKYTIVVVSYEGLSNDWDMLSKIDWDVAVLDEAHFIKGRNTKRCKTALKLRDKAAARFPLTGTPVCNSVMDLFPLLEFMREGGSGFTSFDAYHQFYGVFEARDPNRGTKRLAGVQNLPFMQERLARMSLIVKKAEALPDLPAMQYDIEEVEMTDQQQEIYDKVRDDILAEIESDMSDGTKPINVNNILTKMLRLSQITSGFVALSKVTDLATGDVLADAEIRSFVPNPKLDALAELVADKHPDSKTIVWAHYKQDIRCIMQRMSELGHDAVRFDGSSSEDARDEAVRRFNEDPKCKFFVGNPGAGGTGVNLLGYPPGQGDKYTTNCDHEVYFSQDWSHPKRSQSEARPHRNGTRVPIRVTDLTVIGTIDEEIRARVTDKRASALQVQDLRDVLNKVLRRRGQ